MKAKHESVRLFKANNLTQKGLHGAKQQKRENSKF